VSGWEIDVDADAVFESIAEVPAGLAVAGVTGLAHIGP
jgi:hypothetical protein